MSGLLEAQQQVIAETRRHVHTITSAPNATLRDVAVEDLVDYVVALLWSIHDQGWRAGVRDTVEHIKAPGERASLEQRATWR